MAGSVRRRTAGFSIVLAGAASLLWSEVANAQQPSPGAEPTPIVTPVEGDPPAPPAVPPKPEAPPGPRRTRGKEDLSARLEWRWPEFGIAQLGIAIGQGAMAVAGVAIPGQRNWQGTNGFDDAFRNAVRAVDVKDSYIARDASDVGFVLLLNQRLIDSLFVTWWFHDKGSTALQMSLIDLQTISFTAGIQSLTAGLVGRERPYGRAKCVEEGPEQESGDCLGSNRYRSFFSGHSALAFTLAGATCAHHINLPIYGGGPVEAIPCIGNMLIATGVAMLRVVSDQHYLSDILVGSAVGTAAGFAIPYLFHYMHTADNPNAAMRALGITALSIGPQPTGLQMAGAF